jgi:O-acetyl-ADP-ribose deacetylase (regulator of RNase III)
MQFEFIQQGDIFNSGCMVLVNPVNCQGRMGKGLAKEFKKRFPENYEKYVDSCEFGHLFIGHNFVYEEKGQIIINFPTKVEWRKPSQYSYIDEGLIDLANILLYRPFIRSIAIPPLGCGLGGLSWTIVRDMIVTILRSRLGDDYPLTVKVYCP